MVLKEAFEYANLIQNNLRHLSSLMTMGSTNFCKITEVHRKSLADPTLEDVVIDATPDEYDPEKLFKLQGIVLEDMMSLNIGIAEAKRTLHFDLDAAIACNKVMRDAIHDLKLVLNIRKSETKTTDYGYRFNADRNQVAYKYDVIVKSEPNFDRKNILKAVMEMTESVDKTSMKIEQAIVNTPVKFEPRINYRGLSFRDVYDLIED